MRLDKDLFRKLVNELGREKGIISIPQGKFEVWENLDAILKMHKQKPTIKNKEKGIKLELKGSRMTLSSDT